MQSDLEAREQAIVDEFSMFDDWMARYEYLIEQGKALPPMEAAYHDDAHRVRGCQSQVWVHAEGRDGRVYYEADSDALITRGLVALLVRVLSGLCAEEIVAAPLRFIDRIGLQEHLSPTRKNGLTGMIRLMKQYAVQELAVKG